MWWVQILSIVHIDTTYLYHNTLCIQVSIWSSTCNLNLQLSQTPANNPDLKAVPLRTKSRPPNPDHRFGLEPGCPWTFEPLSFVEDVSRRLAEFMWTQTAFFDDRPWPFGRVASSKLCRWEILWTFLLFIIIDYFWKSYRSYAR